MKSLPDRARVLVLLGSAACGCSQNSSAVGASGGVNGSANGGTSSQNAGGTQATGGNSATNTTGTGSSNATGGVSSSATSENASGGAAPTGGRSSSGGSKASGGGPATGGAGSSGGTSPTGGAKATGGSKASGGAAPSGGAPATGGAKATGGSPATGGSEATGGSSAGPRSCTFPSAWAPSSPTYTYYDLPNASTACGYNGSNNTISNIANGQYFAAIPGQSSTNFDTSNRCGACVKIGNAIITIVDECPYDGGQNIPCANNPKGHLDLSRAATSAAGVQGDPNIKNQAAWNFVPCPVTGNVKIRLKPGNNNEFFIENVILPIQSVQCGSQNGSRTSYGAWHFGANVNGQSCSATDIGNSTITFTVGNTQGQDVDSGVQFQKCN